MDKPEFRYVTYIRTTPEKLWEALTTQAFIRKYWAGFQIKTDWKVGSRVELMDAEGTLADSGVMLRVEPPRVLSYSWKHEFFPEIKGERASRVTFEIEPEASSPGVVRLTIVHDDFEPGSKLYEGIRHGWPAIASSIKSLLETGSPLSEQVHLMREVLAARQKS